MQTKNRSVWVFALALIVLLAALLRLWNINLESFWADEGWTMILSKGPTLSDVVQTMASDQHPPLYFALMHYWIDLVGNSEVTTRLLSTFWALVGVAAIYRLGADLFSPGAGVAAALLLALADNDIFLAQDARHYTAMACLGALSTLCYFRYLRRPTRGHGIAWLLSSSALMYTHYLGGFILIIQLIHLLIFVRPARRLRDMLFRWAAICLTWLPWAFVFVNQSLVRYTRPILSQSAMPNTPASFGLVRGDLLGSHFVLTAGLILLGLVYIRYGNGAPRLSLQPVRQTMYLAFWLLVPIIGIIVINARYPILTTRNMLLVTPVIALLVGHGLMNLDRPARTFLLIVLVALDLTTVDAYFVKPPWRQVAQDMLNYRAANEPMLLDVWTDSFALQYHIGRDLHADPAALPLVVLPEWRESYGQNFDAHLLEYLKDKDSFWLAYWGDPRNPLFGFFAQQGFVVTATQIETHLQTNQIFVYRFDRAKPDSVARYGDLFALKRAQIDSAVPGKPGDVRVNLLWTALKQPPLDYSVSVFALNPDGQVIAQHDSSPLDGRLPTSGWQVGDLRFDSHTLTLPPGQYTIGVKIYWYGDGKPLSVLPLMNMTGSPDRSAEYFVVGQVAKPSRP